MEIITRYSGLKTRSRAMAEYINNQRSPKTRPDIEKVHATLIRCADYLVFHNYYTIDELRLINATTCKKHLLCPFCARRRAGKMVQQNLPKVESVPASQKALKPALLTFTVKNGESLAERYNHLKKADRRLKQRRRDALKGQKWTEFAKVAGAVTSYEFTKKDENGWHPHIHMLVLLTDWIDRDALAQEWYDLTGDSYIIDIRRIKPSDSPTGGVDIASGLAEVCKYSMKFHDLTLEDTWIAYNVLRTRRLVDSFGLLRGIKLPEQLLDDPLEGLPYLELGYQYRTRSQAYDLVRSTKVEV